MAELNVNILSPAKVVAKTAARQVQAPGILGCLGILPGHTRLVSELGIGELIVDAADGTKLSYFVGGGYLDVAADTVTLLVDVAEKPEAIDVERAEKARQRALDRLEKKIDVDLQRAQAALARAEQRLAVAARSRR